MSSPVDAEPKVIFWHRELPPTSGDLLHEHVMEADSERVAGSIERHGELWHQCYASLMENARRRLEQEVHRLGGHYAHVLDEHVDSRRDDGLGEGWLHGRFHYMLYRRAGSYPPSLTGKEN
jgi:hypothetical protein